MPYQLLKDIAADLCLLDVQHDPILKELDDVVGVKIETAKQEKAAAQAEGKKFKIKRTQEELAMRKIILESIY